MQPDGVVEPFDVSSHRVFGLPSGLPADRALPACYLTPIPSQASADRVTGKRPTASSMLARAMADFSCQTPWGMAFFIISTGALP